MASYVRRHRKRRAQPGLERLHVSDLTTGPPGAPIGVMRAMDFTVIME